MSLEACMIIIDNSEWTRNGDFSPNRFQSQMDAVSIIASSKTAQNAESGVGIIDITGPSCHVSLTTDRELSKLLFCLDKIKIQGSPKFSAAIQVAQLALKHRQNKTQKARILVFVASPIKESTDELVRLARQMKKNNVAIDIVSFGEEETNDSKLNAFIEAVNKEDNSHYLSIPSGFNVNLSEAIGKSPIFSGGDSSGGGYGNDLDSLDPELAQALQLSLQEAQAQQQRQESMQVENAEDIMAIEEEEDEGDDLAQAMAMSYQNNQPMDFDDEMQLAIQQSLAESQKNEQQSSEQHKEVKEEDLSDVSPDEMKNIFQGLPDVDMNDPALQDLLKNMKQDKDKENK